ncbi:MAG: CehA/McbA family metallohydrolase [Kofleriaceae bacterium]|nr:CehA/McbA family metallohydrolase [Kofleriaceae bacterium]
MSRAVASPSSAGARSAANAVRSAMLLAIAIVLGGCGDNAECSLAPFFDGDPVGHRDPLGGGFGEARAGRVTADDLPTVPSGLATWKEGDFVLANDRIALVIEDAGDSDLYDPWGGRPVGLARVEDGRMVAPNNFGELFLLTGRSTVITERVSVLNDGSDGNPAVIRARGKLHPLPFFESLVAIVYNDTYTDIEAAIDYVLAPDADHVDVYFNYALSRESDVVVPSTMHALMYTKRTPAFQVGRGFDDKLDKAAFIALVDDRATSWAYLPGEGVLDTSLAASGFLGSFGPGFTMGACQRTQRLHARIAIGPGLDGAIAAAAGARGETLREITGTVMREGALLIAGAHVHAHDGNGIYYSRAVTDDKGMFTLHVPLDADVTLDAFRRGDAVGSVHVGFDANTATITLPAVGAITVDINDEAGEPIPARVQVVPIAPTTLPSVPGNFGEEPITGGRLYVEFPLQGSLTLPTPPGRWEVIVSRGYEYEIARHTVDVAAGQTTQVVATLEHAVATQATQCADFHIHTSRSNDSGDDGVRKVRQAIADGLELPVRSEHEYVADFSAEIASLGAEKYARGFGSIELTSFELWGHMGVFPLTPDPSLPNAGAPRWQTWPTPEAPDTPFATLSPVSVFDAVRARPEAPVVIINHPRGSTNYFNYVGFDPATGIASNTADWDTKFTLVEVFNDSGWRANRDGLVSDWFSLIDAGRKMFAVGSSDSHGLASSPVGYPRTCIFVGTDDPQALDGSMVRDQLAAGHATISGGIYVAATIGGAGPGDTVPGAGSPLAVDITVQAASWVDVDAVDIVVDGQTVDTIPIMPGDADPANPAIRWRGTVQVQTRATGGFVVAAAYGDQALEPVHPGRMPFGVTNPIFVTP